MGGREEDWLSREQEWWDSLATGEVKKAEVKSNDKALAKKKKALAEMTSSLSESDEDRWKRAGDMLKSHLDLPPELQKFADPKLSRSENIERAFQKAKDLVRKRQGTLARIEKLKSEIEFLENNQGAAPVAEKTSGSRGLEKAQAKGRKLSLGPNLEAICGRSGKDNLAILRQARAWDLWLHLKDYPGAHAIIFRDRNAKVDLASIEKTAQWLIQESPAAKGAESGVKYEVVVAEARFVRPIKGDSLGRVSYQNPTVYSFASKRKR